MRNIRYWLAKIQCKLTKSHKPMIEYYRRGGVKIGENCLICSDILTREPYLIEIGDNVTVSTNVTFVTHDNSVKLLHLQGSDLFGRIVIGSDCFIGENATLLYGVTLPDQTIVAAGSVVTKSFSESRTVLGGNPAHVIGTWDEFAEKAKDKAIRRGDLRSRLEEDDSFLVKK